MKEIKETINSIEEKMEILRKTKRTKKQQKEFDHLNNLRYMYGNILERERLKAKVKRLEKENKRLKNLLRGC